MHNAMTKKNTNLFFSEIQTLNYRCFRISVFNVSVIKKKWIFKTCDYSNFIAFSDKEGAITSQKS